MLSRVMQNGASRVHVTPRPCVWKWFQTWMVRLKPDATSGFETGSGDCRYRANQNMSRTPSWITRFELARTPLIEPKAGFVCAPVTKSKVATVFTP